MTGQPDLVVAGVASVLKQWLRQHGYPVVADDSLVPIGWLRDEITKLLEEPQVDGRASAASAWNRALLAVGGVLTHYENEPEP